MRIAMMRVWALVPLMLCGAGGCDVRSLVSRSDQRRISGFAPIFSLLRLIDAESGQVLRYDRGITDQYNSTVTYASMAFY